MTASPGSITYGNDILGNRTSKTGSISYTWDEVNRMKTFASGSNTWTYLYRADGMRVKKSKSSTQYWNYFYDGQMPVEEFYYWFPSQQAYTQVIRYGIGARGIDFIERYTSTQQTIKGYPIYDGHGNMVATLAKNGGGFTLNDRRAYDAWGNIRRGNATGEPRGTYCANLGHVQDDESGLQYMRARYYEPWTGRFVSEDFEHQGWNYFVYCENDPIGRTDFSGKYFTPENILAGLFLAAFLLHAAVWIAWRYIMPIALTVGLASYLTIAVTEQVNAGVWEQVVAGTGGVIGGGALTALLVRLQAPQMLQALSTALKMGSNAWMCGIAAGAVATAAVYSIVLCSVMIFEDWARENL